MKWNWKKDFKKRRKKMTPIVELVEYLMPKHIIVPQGDIVGFTYNRKKKELRFITEKEAKKLTRKRIAWWRMDNWQKFKETIKGERK